MKRLMGITAGLLLAATIAFAQEPLHARVSIDSGGSLVRGKVDDDWSYATVNTLILPGDTIWADKKGVMELEMPAGVFLRLADGSKAEIAQLPPAGQVRGWTGSFYIQRIRRSPGVFTLDTPACSIAIQPDSMVRVDITSDGATTVSVHWGNADIASGSAAATASIGEGNRIFVDPGMLPSKPVYFDRTEEDSFDTWNRERTRLIALGENAIPSETPIKSAPMGTADLSAYGEWVYIDSAPYWRPTVIVDYVPYRTGHWSNVPGCGYVWVGDYPFCYVTSHYGRWRYADSYGWVWTYRDEWGPAWCSTMQIGSNYVWCPMDIYDRPCTYGSATFVVGGVVFSVGTSSYCPVDRLYLGPCPGMPCTPQIVNNIIIAENVYIWDIEGHGKPHYRPPFDRDIPLTRDYSPRRAIRGPETLDGLKVAARDRAVTLEREAPVRQNRSEPIGVGSGTRTPVGRDIRQAQPRTASIDAETARSTHASIERVRRSNPAAFSQEGGASATNRRLERAVNQPSPQDRPETASTRRTPSTDSSGSGVSSRPISTPGQEISPAERNHTRGAAGASTANQGRASRETQPSVTPDRTAPNTTRMDRNTGSANTRGNSSSGAAAASERRMTVPRTPMSPSEGINRPQQTVTPTPTVRTNNRQVTQPSVQRRQTTPVVEQANPVQRQPVNTYTAPPVQRNIPEVSNAPVRQTRSRSPQVESPVTITQPEIRNERQQINAAPEIVQPRQNISAPTIQSNRENSITRSRENQSDDAASNSSTRRMRGNR